MTKLEALELVRQHVKNKNLVSHMICAGAVMRALAEKFEPKAIDSWELTGLLHDIDWEETADTPEQHSIVCQEYLKLAGVEENVCKAIHVHNHMHDIEPETMMEKALYSAEELTGLIVACALVIPSKKLADVKVGSILKKFKQPSFAAGVNREIVMKSEKMLGMSLEELAVLELEAMQGIANELGL